MTSALPPGAGAGLPRGLGLEGAFGLCQLLLDGGPVGQERLLEQLALPGGGQRLAFLAEAHALVVGELEGQGLDFQLGGLEGLLVLGEGLDFEFRRPQGRLVAGDGLAGGGQLVEQPSDVLRGQKRRARGGWNGIREDRSGLGIHGGIIPWKQV